MVSKSEKYVLEIEIFALSRGCRGQISRSCAQKWLFSSQYMGNLKGPTFSTELADRGLSGRASIGQIRHFERGYEGMSIFGEGL